MIKCVVCNGTGINEEAMKGYRRYQCVACEGKKKVKDPFGREEKENGKTKNS